MVKRVASYVVVAVLAGLLVFLLTSQQSERPVVEAPSTDATEPARDGLGDDDEVDDNSAVEDANDGDGDDRASNGSDEEAVPSLLDQPVAPPDARPAVVRRLADGDSFDITWLDTDERDEVRMFGINAPEGGACFGDAAKDVLAILIDDQDLLIEVIERDEFGRVLGNVWAGDVFVNATVVEVGAALALSDGGQYARLITEAQDVARSSGAGLWDPTACGADPAAQVQIAEIMANAPGRDDQNKNGEWIAIENVGIAAVDMTDWSIRDESTRHRFFFPAGHFIEPGDVTIVFSGCGEDTFDELFWCDDDPVWNNGGDTGFLVDPDGKFADSLSYNG